MKPRYCIKKTLRQTAPPPVDSKQTFETFYLKQVTHLAANNTVRAVRATRGLGRVNVGSCTLVRARW